jgi:hypothetical protein
VPLEVGPGSYLRPYWVDDLSSFVPVLGDTRQRIHILMTHPRVIFGVEAFPPDEVGEVDPFPSVVHNMVHFKEVWGKTSFVRD